ncbi:KilA-N domain-containing protein, partial [Acinetobacter baumannii]|nr:KilA-N domain-containing protein [Acinetobacter baumannii]
MNALHRASGGDNSKRPSLWLANKQAQELIT